MSHAVSLWLIFFFSFQNALVITDLESLDLQIYLTPEEIK